MRCPLKCFVVIAAWLVLVACQPAQERQALPEQLTFNWHYQHFVAEFVSADGRVIDPSSERLISTSEGQAYGMWFALLANDHARFDKLLVWANHNLAAGGLGDQLPSWLWGRTDEGSSTWGLIDKNAASDADIWMAYSLLMAAERWQEPQYEALGQRLAARIIELSTIELADLRVLLPGPEGFSHVNYVLLNPSYFSLTLFRGLAALTGDMRWQQVFDSSVYILQQLSAEPHGVIPDWLAIDYSGKLLLPEIVHAKHELDVTVGSYDAIRTYLWLAWEAQRKPSLVPIASFMAPYHFIAEHKYPAVELTRYQEAGVGRGPIGFSAILLPYIAYFTLQAETSTQAKIMLADQKARVLSFKHDSYRRNYYDTMLIMFGTSALQCVHFTEQGLLDLANKDINDCDF